MPYAVDPVSALQLWELSEQLISPKARGINALQRKGALRGHCSRRSIWFLSMKYELAQMRNQGFGALVNVGSDAGLLGVPGHSGYVASKHAGIGLTRSAALE